MESNEENFTQNQYQDAITSNHQMEIVKKFDEVINYLYPILQNAPRVHGSLRNRILDSLFQQVENFIVAGKSNQKSKLYICDAGLANLRYLLRFASHPKRRLLTQNQHKVSIIKVSECGSMLNAWIKKRK